MSDLIGQTIDRYQILEQLGQGGMATVYLGYDSRLDRKVAIKVIRRDTFPPVMLEKILKRFEREAKALARLNHPNIVGVIDYGNFNGSPYLVMPFIPSGTLKEKLGKPIHYAEAARILVPIARALAYAHAEDIIHRDVKPSNILITRSGEPVLTDFGIAKILEEVDGNTLTSTGMGLGTPEYMAPEQWYGKADASSDQYALGVIFYEMVTGQKPYTADTPPAVMLKQATEIFPQPSTYIQDLPEEVEITIQRMLEKIAEKRFSSLKTVVNTLDCMAHDTQDLSSLAKEEIIFPKEEVDLKTELELLDTISENQKISDELNSTSEPEIDLINDDPNHTDVNEVRYEIEDPQPSHLVKEQNKNWNELNLITQDVIIDDSKETLPLPVVDEFSDEAINEENDEENNFLVSDKREISSESFPDQPFSIKFDNDLLKSEENDEEIDPKKFNIQNSPSKKSNINNKLVIITGTVIIFSVLLFILLSGKIFNSSNEKTLGLVTEQTSPLVTTETQLAVLAMIPTDTSSSPTKTILPTTEKTPTQIPTIQLTPTKMPEIITLNNVGSLTEIDTKLTGQNFSFSPDGELVAVANNNVVNIVDSQTLIVKSTFTTEGEIKGIKFSPTNKIIAITEKNYLSLISIEKGEIYEKLDSDPLYSFAIDFSNDGKYLAYASDYNLIKIWNVEERKEVYPVAASSSSLYSLDFSPVTPLLASIYCYIDYSDPHYYGDIKAYPNICSLRLRQIDTGKILLNLLLSKLGNSNLKFSPDGTILAAGLGDSIWLWNTENGYIINELQSQQQFTSNLDFSHDGKLLVSGYMDGKIRLWNVETGELLQTIEGNYGSPIVTISFTPDGTRIFASFEDSKILSWGVK